MRFPVLLLAVLTVLVVAAPTAYAVERPEARMLLDLDLLHDFDPRVHRELNASESRPLLEFLQRVERAAVERSRREPAPKPSKDAC